MRSAPRLALASLAVLALILAVVYLSPAAPPAASPAAALKQTASFGPFMDGENRSVEEWWLGLRSLPGQTVSSSSYDAAVRQMGRAPGAIGRRFEEPASLLPTGNPNLTRVQGVVWKPIGPSPIVQGTSRVNGRVSSIAIHPNNSNVIYIGASGGGVWRTTDGGGNWTPILDQESSLGLGEPAAIAIDPTNTSTIYVGTSGRFVNNTSKGILKSIDGGGSWIVLGSGFPAGNTGNADTLFAGRSINVIIVDPANPNTLYLGASNGLFRSTDGGRNWNLGTGGTGDARSLVMDSTSPAANRILYAGIDSSGVRQSTNGGQSWTTILNAATPAVSGVLAGGGFGHVVVALAPPTSPANVNGIQVLYVTMAGSGGAPDPVGIFQSIDQGTNWTSRGAAGLATNTQGGYDLTMGVDATSPGDGLNDIVYIAGVSQFRSTDAGANFTNTANGQHVDTHAAWTFVPQPAPNPPKVYTGNDGGVWRSDDAGATWTGTGLPGAPATINAGSYQTALIYNLDIRNDATGSVTIGTLQDNGTVRGTGALSWPDTQGGDGWDIAFDPVNTSNAYVSSGFWSPAPCTRVWKSTDSGASWPFAMEVTPWGTTTDAGCYLAPVNADPSVGDRIYVSGSQNIWQTSDGGANWRIIANIGGQAQLSVAPANSNNVVVATGTQVSVSTNALAATVGPPTGVTFTNITRNLPPRNVMRVIFDPIDPTVIYATLSGFDTQTPATPGHVFRTTIAGTAWTDISPPVDAPVNAVVMDPATNPPVLYVGTDVGILRSVDAGASWTTLDDVHLPNAPVSDLEINSQAGVLRASTFGRGVWELAAASGPVIAINAEAGLDFGDVCSDDPLTLQLSIFNVGTGDLIIHSVQRLMGSTDFSVLPNPSTPLVISPDAHVDFTVRFAPTSVGPQSATIRISSNDPGAPNFDLTASGNADRPVIDTLIANSGSFGEVCRGDFRDLELTINNSGGCDLIVGSISSNSAQFQVPSTVTLPLTVGPGDSLQVPIRFAPTSLGPKSATLTITSNDPSSPSRQISVSGDVPPGDVRVTGSTEFGDVCAGALAEKTVSVCNVGHCDLDVISVSLNAGCADFTLINNPFPALVSPDSCQDVVIRFTPTSVGPKSCTLTIVTDDPDQPVISLPVTGNTPAPMIDVPPDQAFAPTVIQPLGACTTAQPFPVSNTGTCPLNITAMGITANPDEYSLSGLPSFPIILETGHIAGEGDLNTVFGPDLLGRERMGALSVTWLSDPITGATTEVTRALCGEGVHTGARVLVTAGGVPVATVESLKIQRINANRNKNLLDTVESARDLPLQTVVPAAPCAPFRYHREYGTVSNPIQLLPGSYNVTATIRLNGHRVKKTVGFDLNTCGFNPTITINF